MSLSAAQRIELQRWVFEYTDAKVVSDPDFRVVERLIDEECAGVQAEVERLKNRPENVDNKRLVERYNQARDVANGQRRRAVIAEQAERELREMLDTLLTVWSMERVLYPTDDPQGVAAHAAVKLCEHGLREVLDGNPKWRLDS